MDSQKPRIDAKQMRETFSPLALHFLDSLQRQINGEDTGWGINDDDLQDVQTHIDAIRDYIERSDWSLLNRRAWDEYATSIRYSQNCKRVDAVQDDMSYQMAFGSAVRRLFVKAIERPRNKRQRAELARLQAEVNELYGGAK
jgi:hypothetical protein